MASGPITSGQIDGETVETVSDFTFWAPKSLKQKASYMKKINKINKLPARMMKIFKKQK